MLFHFVNENIVKTFFHSCLFGHLKLNVVLSSGTCRDTPAFVHYSSRAADVGQKSAELNGSARLQVSSVSPLTALLLGC